MSRFFKGFIIGGFLAGSYVLLNVEQSGEQTRKQLRLYFEQLKEQSQQVKHDAERIQNKLNYLTEEGLPTIKQAAWETQRLITQFEQNSRPRLRRFQSRLNDLQEHVNETIQIFEQK